MVATNFQEVLEVLAFEKKKCEIVFSDAGGRITMNTIVEGLYEKEGQPVVRLQSGQEIPLADVLLVNGMPPGNAC